MVGAKSFTKRVSHFYILNQILTDYQPSIYVIIMLCFRHETLQRISRAADSISLGDLVESKIRRSQAWSLLPTQVTLK